MPGCGPLWLAGDMGKPMVRRSTWIMVVVFVLAGGFVFAYQRFQANKTVNAPSETPTIIPEKLYSMPIADVDKINIADNSGESITLYRNPDTAAWVIAEYPIDKVNSTQIKSTNAQLLAISVKETLPDTTPLSAVGLDSPAYTITMTTMEGTLVITYVGSPTPTGSGYYVRIGTGPVVIVDKTIMEAVVDMVKNPPLLSTPTPEVTETGTVVPGITQPQSTQSDSGTPLTTQNPATPTVPITPVNTQPQATPTP